MWARKSQINRCNSKNSNSRSARRQRAVSRVCNRSIEPLESRTMLSAALVDPTATGFSTSLSLTPGAQTYIYGEVTGGGASSSPLANGSADTVTDGAGNLGVGLAVTTQASNSFTTQTGYYSIAGVGVSGYTNMQALYGQYVNPNSGVISSGSFGTSVTFTLTQPALVVAMGGGSSQQAISFSGVAGLVTDAAVSGTGNGLANTIGIAHDSLGPGTYTIQLSTTVTSNGQEQEHVADLLGVYIFTGSTVAGLQPAQVRHAYGFDQLSLNGAGQTIAIVDPYFDPHIGSDVQAFDSQFNLPQLDGINGDPALFIDALTSETPPASGANSNAWYETALDVEWAHAIAPMANIDLVEAPPGAINLEDAAAKAANLPFVSVVSMSFGEPDDFSAMISDSLSNLDFTPPAVPSGITFVAASGDSSDANYPASSPDVLGVGGTTLFVDESGNRQTSTNSDGEVYWNDTAGFGGYGTNTGAFEPSYQEGLATETGLIKLRSVPDVSYAADGNIAGDLAGYATYVTTNSGSGWVEQAGTSAGTPQWAALIALANQGRAQKGLDPFSSDASASISQQVQEALYSAPAQDFYLNGAPSGDEAYQGYNAETGLGTPLANLLVNYLVNWSPKVAVTSHPNTITAGQAFDVTAVIEDQNGNVLTNDSFTHITLSLAPDPILNGTTTVTAVNGVATFTNLTLDTSGNFSFVVADPTDGLAASAPSTPIAISPAAAAQLAFIQQPTNTTAGNVISPAVTVAVEDQFGNVVTTDNSYVTLRVGAGGSTDGDDNVLLSSFLSRGFGPIRDSDWNGRCANGFHHTLSVKVQDGLATFANLSLDKAGEYALKATDHCLSSATSTSFAVTPAAAVRMVFFDIPSCDSNGKTFKVQVALFDRYGNLATNDTSSVTLSLGAHPKNDVLTGTLTAVVVNGIATFDDLSLSGEGWYSLVAMDSDGIPSISSSLIYFGRDVCGFV